MAGSSDQPKLAPSALEGNTLNGVYEVEEKLAHGGMAWVYRARHIRFGTSWAVKILFPHHAENTSIRERFLRESYIQHQLTHPHIVRVHDLIEERGVCGYVMEWCGEGDLRHLLRGYRGPLPLGQVAGLFEKIVSGVGYAHKRGIVHRDLKPENILISKQDDIYLPKITDFGIAKVLEEAGHTDTGSAIGTFSYMSPEQFLDAKSIDERSDIYSLGVLLYLLTTGRLPFHFEKGAQSNFLGMMLKVQHEPPPPADELPQALQDVIMRCLEKESKDRYPTCEALGEALHDAWVAESIEVAPLDLPPAGGALLDFESSSITPSPMGAVIPTGQLSNEHTPLPMADVLLDAHTSRNPETQEKLPSVGHELTAQDEDLEILDASDMLDELPESTESREGATSHRASLDGPKPWALAAILGGAALFLGLGLFWMFGGNGTSTPKSKANKRRSLPQARVGRTLSGAPMGLVVTRRVAPKQRLSKAQQEARKKAFGRIASLLRKERWRAAMTLFQSAAKLKLDLCGTTQLLKSLAASFPEAVQGRLQLLVRRAKGNAMAVAELKRCGALEPSLGAKIGPLAASQQTIQALFVQLKKLRSKNDPRAASRPLSRQERQLIDAMWKASRDGIARHPTSTGLLWQQQQLRDYLAVWLPAANEALAWTRGLHQECSAAHTSGLLAWRRLWVPALYTLEQLEAKARHLAALARLWSWAHAYRRNYHRGQFALLERYAEQWRTTYRALSLKDGLKQHRPAILKLVKLPLSQRAALQPVGLLHRAVLNLLRKEQYKRAHRALSRLREHLSGNQAFGVAQRKSWSRQFKARQNSIRKQLRAAGATAMKQRQWRKARKLFDTYLKLFPRSADGPRLRKRRARAHLCASAPPGLCQ